MTPFHDDIESVLRGIEDVTWLNYQRMFLSSLGTFSHKGIRKGIRYNAKDDHVTVGFLVTNHKTHFALETTMIKDAITKLGHKYRTSTWEPFDATKYSSSHITYHIFKHCAYYPLVIELDENIGDVKCVKVSKYANDFMPITNSSGTINLLSVDVHKDDIRSFLINLNINDVGRYIQHIIYNGNSSLYSSDMVKNGNCSFFLTGYFIENKISFQPTIPGNNKDESLSSLKIKATNVLITSLAKKENMTKNDALLYLRDKQYSLLDTNFIKINFRLESANKNTWSFLFNGIDKGNVVPSMINWKNGIPQGGIVYCPVEYFAKFINRLKLFNYSYLNLNYYPNFQH